MMRSPEVCGGYDDNKGVDEVGHEGDPGEGSEEAPGQKIPYRTPITCTYQNINSFIYIQRFQSIFMYLTITLLQLPSSESTMSKDAGIEPIFPIYRIFHQPPVLFIE
jgi:hypothetical protein